jgi:16S rRNA C967 or C1407 C5-methylase (RsmB/RsmF family)
MAAERSGAEAFEHHYEEAFGARWPRLRAALLEGSGDKTVRENAFANPKERADLFSGLVPHQAEGCFRFPEGMQVSSRDRSGLRLGYVMDVASVWAARTLPLLGARAVLDLCAAPGGKSLVLAEGLPEEATLLVNDRSPARRQRLKTTLADYLPASVQTRTRVVGMDGRKLGLRHPDRFDAILLDAPCSSERHVLRDPAALAKWSPHRVRQLARDQYALLTSALLALRQGGALVYCTCALLPDENDGVIERLLRRGRHPAKVERLALSGAEPTTHGCQYLPDSSGAGPLYVALIRKIADAGLGRPQGEEEAL